MRRKVELGTVIFFIVAAVMVTGVAMYMYMAHMVERTTGQSLIFEKLSRVNQVVNNRYVGKIDEEKAMDSLISGYIDGIDQYGVYLNKTGYLDFKKSTEGKTSGIGATVKYASSTGYLKITRVISGSPCDKAGLMAGDIISKINGVDLSTISYTEATNQLKAQVGTDIKLTVLRGDKTVNATVTVLEYTAATVGGKMIGTKIGYVSISEFDANTAADFKQQVESLRDSGATSLIFDVRNNTGGSLTAVTEILDYILPEGKICSTKDKNGEEAEYLSDANCISERIVVLINGETYSGGELFAAAIRDFNYGNLIGTTTYGKGMAQEVIPLGDDSALYLSTNLYYPPNGINYDGIGVLPDQEVTMPPELEERFYELTTGEDPQLQAAITSLE